MKQDDENPAGNKRRLGNAERDIVALGIATAALILFVGTGGTVMPQVIASLLQGGDAPDVLLTNAVLLNVALIIFGWRRYRDLQNEVQERRQAEQLARELAEVDPLTGALNRRSGLPSIEKLLSKSRAQNSHVAVLMVDLDNFKQINDLNGHQMGDLVLSTIARRITDLLPNDGILVRIGGDEFCCAVSYTSAEKERIETLADNLITVASSPISCEHLTVESTVSIGIATSKDDPEIDADLMVHRADIAMYHAKKRGRSRFFWFETQMEDELRYRNELEAAIRRGIPARQFVPYYEQQIDLETGELVGFEMLARWNSPQYGVVGPDIFIPIAEDIDLIGELSESLIRQALKDACKWDPKLTLSVNISPLQMRDPWFAQKLLHLLVETGFPAARLEVEITESTLHENVVAVRSIISSLKNQGIKISLDDFGTGYSSLAQLRALPFDRLKIDRSFVAEMAKGENGAELVEAIISLGKGLSLPVTAEGVENEEVLGALRELGRLKGQGYLYGRPEDAETTAKRLKDKGLLVEAAAKETTPSGELAGDVRKAG